jgi:hypothetical protein
MLFVGKRFLKISYRLKDVSHRRERREGWRVNNIEIHCICVGTRCDEMH